MRENFPKSLHLTLVHEGGYVNDPRDPGGATMRGVTQAVYDKYLQGRGQTQRPVRTISDTEMSDIYKTGYWDQIQGDELPLGVDYCVFDAAVNSGPSRAAKWLQAAIGVTPDGSIGPHTLAAVQAADPKTLISKICASRLAFCQSLPTWGAFGKGWEKRFGEVEIEANGMVGSSTSG